MVKTIKIGNKSYDMKSSAFTPFKYKNDFGTDFLKDINKFNKIQLRVEKLPKEEQQTEWLDNISDIQEIIFQITYTMIAENDPTFGTFEDFLKGLDNIYENSDWMMEVMTLAVGTFQGRVEK